MIQAQPSYASRKGRILKRVNLINSANLAFVIEKLVVLFSHCLELVDLVHLRRIASPIYYA